LLQKLPDKSNFDLEAWSQIQQIFRFMILKTFEQEAEGLIIGQHKEQLELIDLQNELQMRSSEVESAQLF